jgi:ubiquinone/menaquinone biosynthesis C-methylase UbiE
MATTKDTDRRRTRDAGPENDGAANGSMSNADIRSAYDEYADWVRRFEPLARLLTGRYRRHQFGDATGRVLDVACGTGTNFRYLPDGAEVVGVDISPAMLEAAGDRLDDLPIDGTLHEMDAANLAFDDDSFDTVISSLSTCTFPDPVAALREMARVCAPDGEIRLLEHGRSDVGVVARYQEWRADAHYEKAGCRMTQEPLEVLDRAGIPVEESETAQLGRITMVSASPEVDTEAGRPRGDR